MINLLAVSFAYPPLAYPRSIQVARLLKYLNASTVMICADEAGARKDDSLEPDAEAKLEKCIRVPFTVSGARSLADRFSHRLFKPLWNYQNLAPDRYGAWKRPVLAVVKELTNSETGRFDAAVTFGQPFTDHLIGLELKQRFGLPWLAHFSDPWVDNPFNRYGDRTRELNLKLERKVIEAADILAFTSAETIDLVMKKYPSALRAKTRVLPQSFEPDHFRDHTPAVHGPIAIRYIGNFYGHRTPAPLIDALRHLITANGLVLENVRFELVGIVGEEMLRACNSESLPEGLLNICPQVGYSDSLRSMATADGLLVVDAPADVSVFLPSKLIDYIGAGRPILGLTPPGTAASLISELGGNVADPSDIDSMASAINEFIVLLKRRRAENSAANWGTSNVRQRFEASFVAAYFHTMLNEIISDRH